MQHFNIAIVIQVLIECNNFFFIKSPKTTIKKAARYYSHFTGSVWKVCVNMETSLDSKWTAPWLAFIFIVVKESTGFAHFKKSEEEARSRSSPKWLGTCTVYPHPWATISLSLLQGIFQAERGAVSSQPHRCASSLPCPKSLRHWDSAFLKAFSCHYLYSKSAELALNCYSNPSPLPFSGIMAKSLSNRSWGVGAWGGMCWGPWGTYQSGHIWYIYIFLTYRCSPGLWPWNIGWRALL